MMLLLLLNNGETHAVKVNGGTNIRSPIYPSWLTHLIMLYQEYASQSYIHIMMTSTEDARDIAGEGPVRILFKLCSPIRFEFSLNEGRGCWTEQNIHVSRRELVKLHMNSSQYMPIVLPSYFCLWSEMKASSFIKGHAQLIKVKQQASKYVILSRIFILVHVLHRN